jgi:hypothetical protein
MSKVPYDESTWAQILQQLRPGSAATPGQAWNPSKGVRGYLDRGGDAYGSRDHGSGGGDADVGKWGRTVPSHHRNGRGNPGHHQYPARACGNTVARDNVAAGGNTLRTEDTRHGHLCW